MRAVLLARVSTLEQSKHGFSISEQLRSLRDHAVREKLVVVEEIVEDGVSGAATDREALKRVMELAEAKKMDVVLATRRDRLFRSRLYRLLFEEDLRDFGVSLEALDDTGNRFGDAILDEYASFERDQIAERSRRGKLEKARQGKIVAGSRPKYGFRFSEDKDHLEVNEEKMEVVRRIYRDVATGATINSVALALTREGVPTAKAARKWSAQSVRDLLLDDAYTPSEDSGVDTGTWWFNRRRFYKDRSGSRRMEWRPRAEWIPVPVPASGVSRETANRARRNISKNRKISSLGERFWELSGGMARCGVCGHALTYQSSSTRQGKRYHYYTCRTFYDQGRDVCPGKLNFKAEVLEEFVWRRVSTVLRDPALLRRGIERMIKRQRKEWLADPEGRERRLRKVLEDNESKRARFQHLYAEEMMDLEDLRARLSELESTRLEANRELERVMFERKRAAALQTDTEALMASYSAIASEDLDSLSPEERHGVYMRLGLEVRARKDREPEISGAMGDARVSESSRMTLTIREFQKSATPLRFRFVA